MKEDPIYQESRIIRLREDSSALEFAWRSSPTTTKHISGNSYYFLQEKEPPKGYFEGFLYVNILYSNKND